MKKLISFLTVFFMLIVLHPSAEDSAITMFAPDGRTIEVSLADKDAYKAVGWYENYSDVTKTMYAPDGRELTVWLTEIEAYKAVGWYENKSDVTKTMYAPDGRELTVWITEIEAYKAVGWYENKSDVTVLMCAADGRQITVFQTQVADYQKVGWFLCQSKEVDPAKPMVALTFDDGPKRASTERILKALETYQARATFFVVGNRIPGNEDILKRMDALGCQVGNHTYNHPDLAKQSAGGIASQISGTDYNIYRAIGKYSTVVRPPYGSVNSTVRSAIGKPLILWSLDTLDWKHRNASYVTNAVLSKVKDGDIILMHDIHDTSATAAQTIIPSLIQAGYQLVTVDELALYKGYTMPAHKTYNSFR